ncbi:MAG: PKD domain-containing protein [Saccharospirillum sp.]|uniref:PKD domain-containing protein n=1 Tax=Pseudomonadota TaxID=1224 RepID=UPI0032997B9C
MLQFFRSKIRESIFRHPLIVGIISAATGAIIGSLATRVSLTNEPPLASIVPKQLEVNAAETVGFDARQSYDPDGEIVAYHWEVGGQGIDNSPVASCYTKDSERQMDCRFGIPSSHSVSVSVEDQNGVSTTSTAIVKVIVPDGYYGFMLKKRTGGVLDEALIQAFNMAIDWPSVQYNFGGIPILLYDPVKKEVVYAVSVEQSVEGAKSLVNENQLSGDLEIVGFASTEAEDLIAAGLREVGLDARFITPSGLASALQQRGDASFRSLSSLSELRQYYIDSEDSETE